jgi:hypothetical protein
LTTARCNASLVKSPDEVNGLLTPSMAIKWLVTRMISLTISHFANMPLSSLILDHWRETLQPPSAMLRVNTERRVHRPESFEHIISVLQDVDVNIERRVFQKIGRDPSNTRPASAQSYR